jgi:glycosyltransferase involved in cell wall biosynthesis
MSTIMSTVTVTFFAIVKNEEKIIERCLKSVLPLVDYIVISDTGSTDSTVEKIENFILKHGKKGKVYKDIWVNFGVNRTLSIENAQSWLKSENINQSTNYLLTVDADMCLNIDRNFKKENLQLAKCWQIRQFNDVLYYYNSRIFRADLPVKCVGSTHEFWHHDDMANIIKKNETLSIKDIGDGGSKNDKYNRDIKLLLNDIETDPNNHRSLFYLAQSYFDVGDLESSAKWYTKRVEAGGWPEELLIACTRLGEIYIKMGKPEKALSSWADGYNFNPKRAESLIRIANYYRMNRKFQLSMIYLRQLAIMEFPIDQVLFVEYKVYEYGLYEELCTTSIFCGNRDCGFMACNYLILKSQEENSKGPLSELKKMAHHHIPFFLKPLIWKNRYIFDLSEIKTIWKSSSASLFSTPNHVSGVVRGVNYSISDKFEYNIRDINNVVRTKNYWVSFKKIDDKGKKLPLVLKSIYELECNVPTVRTSHISGLEDMRIVEANKRILGLAVDWERGIHNHPSVVITHLEEDKSGKMIVSRIVPTKFHSEICQKNWVPFYNNDMFMAIYSHHPLIILELNPDTGEEKIVCNKFSRYDLSTMRGSSIPVKMKNGDWLLIVHEVVQQETRKYYNRILKYSPNWDLITVSTPFYFQTLFVEFCLSIYIENNILYIPYSSRDNTTELVSIEIDKIPWLPEGDKEYREWIRKRI